MVAPIVGFLFLPCVISHTGIISYAGSDAYPHYESYKDIPGVTDSEIGQIDKVIGKYSDAAGGTAVFSYGMTESSEAFFNEEGEPRGYSKSMCDLLSALFSTDSSPVRFELEIENWALLYDGLQSKQIDFSGDIIYAQEREDAFFMTKPISERSVKYVMRKDAHSPQELAGNGKVRYAFIDDTILEGKLRPKLEADYGPALEVSYVEDTADAYGKLMDDTIDVFVEDDALIDDFIGKMNVGIHVFYPLSYEQIVMATCNEELAPLLSVIDKYIDQGFRHELNGLYTEGEQDFLKSIFIKSLSPEERSYYDAHIDGKDAINAGLSSFNYPVSFYNENDGVWGGIAEDVIDEIKGVTGLNIRVANEPGAEWSQLLSDLEEGKIAFVTELLKTDDRVGKFLWADEAYVTDYYALVSRVDYPYVNVNELMTERVGLLENTAYSVMFKDWFPDNAFTKEYQNIDEAVAALEKGDVDLVMSTENHLFGQTNYFGKTDLKINMKFGYPSESSFGFNIHETQLAGILSKAQALVDTDEIAEYWTHRVYDYETQMAQAQSKTMMVVTILMIVGMMFLIFILYSRRKQKSNLQRLVNERTEKLEEQTKLAQAASKTKSHFLANMSHEMRTPLNAVIGLSELMIGTGNAKDEYEENLKKIHGAGTTLLGIINNILDISKVESGKFELVLAEYDVPSIINDTVTLNIMRIEDKPVTFDLSVKGGILHKLVGDELRVKQIFNNILTNAFKYTKSGTVNWSLSTEVIPGGEEGGDGSEAPYVLLTSVVADTGVGMREENLKELFSDYNQVDVKANRQIEGTGLGLSLTKMMIDAMGGTISVESEYGKGSVFTVTLKQGFVNGIQIGDSVAENLKNFKYMENKRDAGLKLVRIHMPYARVLIVDDVATNLDVAKGILKPYGIKMDLVMSGRDAVDLIRREDVKYDAIFMDHMMPELDGIEATKIIREEIGTDYAKNIPIVALTANAIKGNEEMFLEHGFNAFISKPINIMQMDNVLKRWVRDKEKEAADPAAGRALKDDAHPNESARRRISEATVIPGIDVGKALLRFGGDENTLIEVMHSYCRNTPELLERLRALDAEKIRAHPESLHDYVITVHGVKGSSYTLCAESVGRKAEVLESASGANDIEKVLDGNEALIIEAFALIDAIKGFLSDAGAAQEKPMQCKPDGILLARLKEACMNFDMDGIDEITEEIDRYEYEQAEGFADWVKAQVLAMQMDAITARIDELLT
ncbi:MAG: transporter substrate-binding domain-containing protein [Clostridiales Family XIII bacterium]|nr:transporter substrate-binding domain-containing protein [Clostridiales Family XIII bacterium]